MTSERNLRLLKYALAAKVVFCFFVWGLPCLLLPVTMIQNLSVPTPDDPFFMRLAGTFIITLGIAYWYAYKDPIRNKAIVKVGVIDNALVTLLIVFFVIFHDMRSIFMIVSAVLAFIFCIAFLVLMPKEQAA